MNENLVKVCHLKQPTNGEQQRDLVATKPLNVGQCIVTVVGESVIPLRDQQRCGFCLQPGVRRCTGCRRVYYCSEICQKRDWKRRAHSIVCKQWAIVSKQLVGQEAAEPAPLAQLAVQLVAATVKRNKFDGDDSSKRAVDATIRQVRDEWQLTDHWSDLEQRQSDGTADEEPPTQQELPFADEAQFVADFFGLSTDTPPLFESLRRLIAAFSFNVMNVCDEEQRDVGAGLFVPLAQHVNHSCEPNAVVLFTPRPVGVTAHLHVVRPIAAGDSIRISYIELAHHTARRRALLQSQWNFECRCTRCEDPSHPWRLHEPQEKEIQSMFAQLTGALPGKSGPGEARAPRLPGRGGPLNDHDDGGGDWLDYAMDADHVATDTAVAVSEQGEDSSPPALFQFSALLQSCQGVGPDQPDVARQAHDQLAGLSADPGGRPLSWRTPSESSWLIIPVLKALENAAVCAGDRWDAAFAWARQLSAVYEHAYPFPHPMRTVQLYRTAKLALMTNDTDREQSQRAALSYLKQAHEMAQVTHRDQCGSRVALEIKAQLSQAFASYQ